MRKTTITILALCYFTTLSHAEECGNYKYFANVTKVYDGDTITADIDLGFHTWIHGEPLRLFGINAPELKSSSSKKISSEEKAKGIISRDKLREKILGKKITICTIKKKKNNIDKKGKYGRYLAIIFIDNQNVNDWLVSNGYAEYKNY